jgi:predicted NBD/HSP70 family sugar kinase
VGEHLNGIARDLRTFFYLYVSEGIGGGCFVDGQPVLGAFGNAGEVGRMRVHAFADEDQSQTLEGVASLSALRQMVARAGRADASRLSVAALIATDPGILDEWLSTAARYLRIVVANIENVLDPEAIVIGGPLPAACIKQLLDRMQPLIPTVSERSDRRSARILIGSAGRISPALGGATLPLFHGLTPQPRTARSYRPTRVPARWADEIAIGTQAAGRRA